MSETITTPKDIWQNYFANLLIIQYHDKPKAVATIKALLSILNPINQATGNWLINDIRDAFNLDTAVGEQLDWIGKYVGVDRFYSGFKIGNQFSMVTYNNTTANADQFGFSTYSTPILAGFLSYNSLTGYSNNQLSDNDFRTLIRLKILKNNSNASYASIDSAINTIFEGNVKVFFSGSMRMTLFSASSSLNLLTVAMQKDIIMRGAGVMIDSVLPLSYTGRPSTYFGFRTYNSLNSSITGGFGTYSGSSYGFIDDVPDIDLVTDIDSLGYTFDDSVKRIFLSYNDVIKLTI